MSRKVDFIPERGGARNEPGIISFFGRSFSCYMKRPWPDQTCGRGYSQRRGTRRGRTAVGGYHARAAQGTRRRTSRLSTHRQVAVDAGVSYRKKNSYQGKTQNLGADPAGPLPGSPGRGWVAHSRTFRQTSGTFLRFNEPPAQEGRHSRCRPLHTRACACVTRSARQREVYLASTSLTGGSI